MRATGGVKSDQEYGVRYGAECAVLTSDMSGFTRLTRRYGIIHYAGLIMQMRQLVAPVFEHFQACTWVTEADNCFAVFPSAEQAVMAALECTDIAQRFNATTPNRAFHVLIGGIGVDCGTEIIQDCETRKLFGPSVDWSYHLGEEKAKNGDVLISENTLARLASRSLRRRLIFTPRQLAGRIYYSVNSRSQWEHVPLPSDDEMISDNGGCTPVSKPIVHSLLLRSHVSAPVRARIDQRLTAEHVNQAAVVVLGLDLTEVSKRGGPASVIVQTHQIMEATHPVVKRHCGRAIEEFLFLFPDPLQAFLAAYQLKKVIDRLHSSAGNDDRWDFCGVAAHAGGVLIVPGTNVHWGDPVNTASKLAEDVAHDGEMLVTEPIFQRVTASGWGRHHVFQPQSFVASKTELKCFRVNPKDREGEESSVSRRQTRDRR